MSGHHRSLSFQTLINPSPKHLATKILPFIANHYSTSTSIQELNQIFTKSSSSKPENDIIIVTMSFAVSNEICGVLLAELRPNTTSGRLTRISNICIHSSHRRCGYGSLLLTKALSIVTSKGSTVAVAPLHGSSKRAASRLLLQLGFETSTKLDFVKYLSTTSASQSRSPNTNIMKPFNRTSPLSPSNTSGGEIQLEYWIEGSARKTTRVNVPTYDEAEHIVSNLTQSTDTSLESHNVEKTSMQVADLLCSMKDLSPDHKITMSLRDVLSLQLTSKWWYALQSKRKQQQYVTALGTNEVDNHDVGNSYSSQNRNRNEGTKQYNDDNDDRNGGDGGDGGNGESNAWAMQQQIDQEEQAYEELLLQKSTQSTAASVSPSIPPTITTSNNIYNNNNYDDDTSITSNSNGTTTTTIQIQKDAALVIEQKIHSDTFLSSGLSYIRPGGVRLDFVDNQGKVKYII